MQSDLKNIAKYNIIYMYIIRLAPNIYGGRRIICGRVVFAFLFLKGMVVSNEKITARCFCAFNRSFIAAFCFVRLRSDADGTKGGMHI